MMDQAVHLKVGMDNNGMADAFRSLEASAARSRDAYLNLLAQVLCFELWPEPLKPLQRTKPGLVQGAAIWLDRQLRRAGFALATTQRPQINYWPVLAHTMVGRWRLENVRIVCEAVDAERVPGSFVECGVWRGGASIFARACLARDREVVCCDSFNGLPPDALEPAYQWFDALRVPVAEVEGNFRRYGLLENVRFVPGYFSDTLKTQVMGPVAVLRADGDMHSSTLDILGALYPRVSPGGFVIIDDWCLPQCRSAVEKYRLVNGITEPVVEIDGTGTYWRKQA